LLLAIAGGVVVVWRAIGWRHKPGPAAADSAGTTQAMESPGAAASAETAGPGTDPSASAAAGDVRVQVVKPQPGGLARSTVQPGSLHAFEWAALYAKVSGYLKTQQVDIGDRVKRGQVLAEIDDPELDVAVEQSVAALAEAKARVDQTKAHVVTARAKWEAAVAAVAQAEAELGRATAQRVFRQVQYERIKHLFDLNSIDERLVDEKQDERDAARAAEGAAKAAIATAKANVAAAAAEIVEAQANVAHSEATVQAAQADLDKAKVFAGYEKIISPYDGVITLRTFNRGDFVRGAERGGESPLLVVARTDLMRTVIQVPDRDVPWMARGNRATVEIDALPGQMFHGTVARMADSEDPQSRTMRVEVDLPNPTGQLREGMYGRATIMATAGGKGRRIPSSCLIGPVKDGLGSVYVVRDGKSYLVPVQVAADDGSHAEISRGLADSDEVVVHYSGPIGEAVPVAVVADNGT